MDKCLITAISQTIYNDKMQQTQFGNKEKLIKDLGEILITYPTQVKEFYINLVLDYD